jgi:hypothetical protein
MPPRSSKGSSKEVEDALTVLFEGIFYQLMIAMVKAQPYEAEYAGFHAVARNLTETQLRRIARYAAEYYAREANPSPGKVPKKRVETLKKAAIEYALKRLAADEKA